MGLKLKKFISGAAKVLGSAGAAVTSNIGNTLNIAGGILSGDTAKIERYANAYVGDQVTNLKSMAGGYGEMVGGNSTQMNSIQTKKAKMTAAELAAMPKAKTEEEVAAEEQGARVESYKQSILNRSRGRMSNTLLGGGAY